MYTYTHTHTHTLNHVKQVAAMNGQMGVISLLLSLGSDPVPSLFPFPSSSIFVLFWSVCISRAHARTRTCTHTLIHPQTDRHTN